MAKIAIISKDEMFIENVAGTFDMMNYEFNVVRDPDSARNALIPGKFSLCLFDEAMAEGEPSLLAQACESSNNIICTDGDEMATIRLLDAFPRVNHVFGKNKPYYHVELTTAVNKILSGNIAGIDRYLAPDTKIERVLVDDYGKRNKYLDQVQAFAEELNCFPDFPEMVATVTWELLMNAMFDAPYDFVEQRPKYADRVREQGIKMQPGEEVQLAFGADDSSFVVSVGDNFGKLTRDTVVECLARCSRAGEDQVRQGNAGAGVGLYMLFNSISQINFNIVPGKKTEVIFAVFLSKRRKDFVLRARSVNFYMG